MHARLVTKTLKKESFSTVLTVYFKPWYSAVRVCVCVFTLQQGGYEGRGHTAGAEQHSVAHMELPFWDPTKNHGSYGGQETHHSGLNLKKRGRWIYRCFPYYYFRKEALLCV